MTTGDVLYAISLICYGGAAVLYFLALTREGERTRRSAPLAALVGLAAQGGGIILRGTQLGRVPLANLYEAVTFVGWALMAIYLITERRYRIAGLGAFVSLIVLVITACASALPKSAAESLLPVLESHWAVVHVASSLIAYASFIVAFVAAASYVQQERMLKSKQMNVMSERLPPLDVADRLAYRMVALGFPLLTLGVVTGALWARSVWGGTFRWDPKVAGAVITWLVYAAYLHVRLIRGWHGRRANRLLIAGFICVVITFLGATLLPFGLHRYGW